MKRIPCKQIFRFGNTSRLPYLAVLTAFFHCVFLLSGVYGQTALVSNLSTLGRLKLSNGLFVHWLVGNLQDATQPAIEVFDQNGSRVVTVNVLAPFREAKEVAIYDVAVWPGHSIVVAAVFASSNSNHKRSTRATLLYFDWSGRLTDAIGLDPSRAIELLDIDENGKVWALLDGSGDRDPARNPVVVVFSGRQIIKSFLDWSYFPDHSYQIDEGPTSEGSPAFGITTDRVWLWLPGYDMVSFDHDGGHLKRMPLNLPVRTIVPSAGNTSNLPEAPPIRVSKCLMLSDGRPLVSLISRDPAVAGGLYLHRDGRILRHSIDLVEGGVAEPIGIDHSEVVFARRDASRNEFRIFRRQL
jgi:hypothetical protein